MKGKMLRHLVTRSPGDRGFKVMSGRTVLCIPTQNKQL